MRGLEPDIQRLVAKQREEVRRLESQMRDDARREVAAERTRAQREMARLQEAGGAERLAAVEKEREACQRRLAEMSAHFEEQLHAQRLRATGQAQAEREAADEGRRRELTRLEGELCAARAKAEAAEASHRSERGAGEPQCFNPPSPSPTSNPNPNPSPTPKPAPNPQASS